MSRPRATAFALLAIVTMASCATNSRSAVTRPEPPRVVDPSAGTVTYKGRTIVFDEAADPPLLSIDGKLIKVHRYSDSHVRETRYGTSIIAYADFTSLWGLARALVDGGMLEYAATR
jgi:hypothetical protein